MNGGGVQTFAPIGANMPMNSWITHYTAVTQTLKIIA